MHNTNCYMQFWYWHVSVFPYLIPFSLYICVCMFNKYKKKKVSLNDPLTNTLKTLFNVTLNKEREGGRKVFFFFLG